MSTWTQGLLPLLLAGCDFPNEPAVYDGDGDYYTRSDCDDASPNVHPGAPEVCDGLDNDCDGDIDGGATDAATFHVDVDGDGYGSTEAVTACTQPDGYVANDADCDDADGAVHPDADELCDESDNDCDGAIDEDAVDFEAFYLDGDGDGYGGGPSLAACTQPDGYVANDADCDDADGAVHPDADELCDELDNDCDSAIDEDAVDVESFYADGDGDGFGDVLSWVTACSTPAGYVGDASDCDDADAAINVLADETCEDGVDQNCDGVDTPCRMEGTFALEDLSDRIVGDDDGDAFGGAVTGAGDVNGDGIGDVWVAAEDEPAAGGLSLFYGPIAGELVAADAAATVSGYRPGGYFDSPSDADGGADTDGDGVPDVVVSGDLGSLLVFGGGLTGVCGIGDVSASLLSSTSGAYVTSFYDGQLGDVTGDGQADLVARSEFFNSQFSTNSMLFFTGPIPADMAAEDAVSAVTDLGQPIFQSPDAHADMDGDGLNDVVVAVQWAGQGLDSVGHGGGVRVYLAPFLGDIHPEDSALSIYDPDSEFNVWSTSAAADIDGDGTADLLAGSPQEGASYEGVGRIFTGTLRGEQVVTAAFATYTNGVAGEYFGYDVASGDLDADGRPDFLASQIAGDGELAIWYAAAAGTYTRDSADVIITPFHAGVAIVGDINGDGIDDAMANKRFWSDGTTAPGAVWPLYGGI